MIDLFIQSGHVEALLVRQACWGYRTACEYLLKIRTLYEKLEDSDEAAATAWVDGLVETLYESFKAGESVTFPGFGGFYVRSEPESWVSKFNPGQRLRALFGWSSTYTGER
ncbi:MAG TPA: HU family DNA-binding protein [Ktedonobacteraceae bacterium]